MAHRTADIALFPADPSHLNGYDCLELSRFASPRSGDEVLATSLRNGAPRTWSGRVMAVAPQSGRILSLVDGESCHHPDGSGTESGTVWMVEADALQLMGMSGSLVLSDCGLAGVAVSIRQYLTELYTTVFFVHSIHIWELLEYPEAESVRLPASFKNNVLTMPMMSYCDQNGPKPKWEAPHVHQGGTSSASVEHLRSTALHSGSAMNPIKLD